MPGNIPGQIRLLQAEICEDGESDLRILIQDKFIKYLKIDAGIYDPDDIAFEPALVELLPELPNGNWNYGHVRRKPHIASDTSVETREAGSVLETEQKTNLPAVTDLWHPVVVDYLDLQIGKRLRSNVEEAHLAAFPGKTHDDLVVKFARFPWDVSYMNKETSVYKLLQRTIDISPRFLGHVSEHGRVIGFMMERIGNFRHAGIEDLSLCKDVLRRLHVMRIKHGDVNRHNFLIHSADGRERATLVDFESAVLCDDQDLLKAEMDSLEMELSDESGRGGELIETEDGFERVA